MECRRGLTMRIHLSNACIVIPYERSFTGLASFCWWMEKTFFSMEKNHPSKNSFCRQKPVFAATGFCQQKLVFATSWQKKNHNQKYFCNYKTSQKYCSRMHLLLMLYTAGCSGKMCQRSAKTHIARDVHSSRFTVLFA